MNLRRFLLAAATLVTAQLSATLPTPEVLLWTNPGSGDWLDSSVWTDGSYTFNWEDGHDAQFTGSGSNVTTNSAVTARNVLIQTGGEGSYNFSGSSNLNYTGYFLVDYGTAQIGEGYSVVGGEGSNLYVGTELSGARLDILGSISAGSASLGVSSTSSGNVVNVGGGEGSAYLTVTGDLNVGFDGASNTLKINDDGHVSASYVKIGGSATSTYNEVVVNDGGSLTVANTLIVGYGGGHNTLTINAGGYVTNVDAIVGYTSGSSNNTVNVGGEGAVWETTGTFYFGEDGHDNRLNVTNGGWVKVLGTSKDAVFGDLSTAVGTTVFIEDAGSKFSNNATLYVGKAGQFTEVVVRDGATLETFNTRISGSAGSANNSLTIKGEGTTWTNGGTLRVGSTGGTASLFIQQGATATVSGNAFLGYSATSSNNQIIVDGAGSSLSVGTLTIGRDGSSTNIVVVSNGASLTSTGAITLGGAHSKLRIGDGEGGTAGTVSATSITTSGTGDNVDHVLEFAHSDANYVFSLNLSGDLKVIHTGTGTTTLTGTLTFTGGTEVTAGILRMNGDYTGKTTVDADSILGGNGTFSGDIDVYGTLAPGNSPGVTTQLVGDTTMISGSFFAAELGGTTPGNGNGFHDQHIVSAGQFIIQPNVTLEIQSWGGFVPARGDVFTLIQTSDGITGTFADMSNLDYSTLVVFDNSSGPHKLGKLYGTGLTGAQTLGAYGTNAAQAAFGDALTAAALTYTASSTLANPAAFVDGSTGAGQMAIAVIMGAPLAGFSPDAYFGLSDYAYATSRTAVDAAFSQGALVRDGAWSLGFGYARSDSRNVPSQRTLGGDTGVFAATYDTSASSQFGFFVGSNHGGTSSPGSHLNYDGTNYGLFARGNSKLGVLPFAYKASVFGGNYLVDGTRDTVVVTPVTGGGVSYSGVTTSMQDVGLSSFGAELILSADAFKKGGFTVTPYLGVVFVHTSSDGFEESVGGLNIDSASSNSSRLLAGFSADYRFSAGLSLGASFGWEHEFSDVSSTLGTELNGSTVNFSSPSIRRDTTVTGVHAAYDFKTGTRISAGLEFRVNPDYRADRRAFISFGQSF